MATRTYWLSFTDSERSRGQQFLGVVIVDVTDADVLDAIVAWMRTHTASMADPIEGPWLAGAIRQCWKAGVNPGGEVASMRMDDHPDFGTYGPRYPRLQRLSRAEIAALSPNEDPERRVSDV